MQTKGVEVVPPLLFCATNICRHLKIKSIILIVIFLGDSMSQKKPTKMQHMQIKWHEIVKSDSDIPAKEAPLKEKTSLVGRVGSMMLSCGTSAWRVRAAMNRICRTLGISSNIDVGLTTIHYTCIEDGKHYSQTIALPTTGVNTESYQANCLYNSSKNIEFIIPFPTIVLKYHIKFVKFYHHTYI